MTKTQASVLPDPVDLTGLDAELVRLLNTQPVVPYVMGMAAENIAAIGPTNGTALAATPVFPVGAVNVRAYVVADLFIMNNTANMQKVTPILQVQVNGLGYNNVWVPGTDVVSVPATDGTSAHIQAVVDVTAYVLTGLVTNLRWNITQTSANSVHYTTQATIFLVHTV